MKKMRRFILIVTGFLAITALINHIIFSLAKLTENKKENYYKWKYGNIHYTVKGKGEPLLLVHDVDIGASLFEWEETINSLSADYTVYALDLLGFGESDKPNISYSAYLYITLINDFIKDIIGEKVNFCGRGLSGSYGTMAYYFEPKHFKKMLLITPSGIGTCSNVPKSHNVWLRWLLESPIIGTGIYNLLSSKFYIGWVKKEYYYENINNVNPKVIKEIYSKAHRSGSNSRYPIASLFNNYLNVSIVHVLPNFKIPLHVVWGDDNQLNPIYNYLEIEKRKPDAQLTIFEHSKIMLHCEKNDEFCKIFKDFLGNS